MSLGKKPRALVVDDELIIRSLVAKALDKEGFDCDTAADGEDATRRSAATHYDLVITDLRMPNKHGYALVVDVLNVQRRPTIIVHTGVTEPKLAKDLFSRGVDDIVYKPIDAALLAARAKALFERRAAASAAHEHADSAESAKSEPAPAGASEHESPDEPITLPRLNQKLAGVSAVLPISKAALDVYHMTRNCDWRISQIAAAIQRDASLAAEVLKLANSSFYNPSSQRVINLEQAVMRIGQKRIGELAIAVNALSALTPNAIPWLDLELAWMRSMAAGVAIESLLEIGNHQALEDGLPLSATMYPLGRVVLGMMFPGHYRAMIDHCWHAGESLREQERRMLPTSHAEVLAHLLTTWCIPPDVCLPLKYSVDNYAALARHSEPARTKAELVKVAVLLGRLAVDRWESWDLVELPPAGVLERLGLDNAGALVRQIRADVSKLAGFCPGGAATEPAPALAQPALGQSVAYCTLSNTQADVLAELLPSVGIQPVHCELSELRSLSEPTLVNGLDSNATRFAAHRNSSGTTVVVTDREHVETFSRFAPTVGLPCAHSRFRDALLSHLEVGAGELAASAVR
jgi:DNA-binding response OmpR family regulator/HD-like signal output (HDOD) protein